MQPSPALKPLATRPDTIARSVDKPQLHSRRSIEIVFPWFAESIDNFRVLLRMKLKNDPSLASHFARGSFSLANSSGLTGPRTRTGKGLLAIAEILRRRLASSSW